MREAAYEDEFESQNGRGGHKGAAGGHRSGAALGELKDELETGLRPEAAPAIKRLEVVEAFRKSAATSRSG